MSDIRGPRYIVRNDYGHGRSVGTRPLTRSEAIESLMQRTGALEDECRAAVDSLVPAPVVVPRHGSPRALTGAASVELALDCDCDERHIARRVGIGSIPS